MKIETTYIAEDGKKFTSEKECKEYENKLKKNHTIKVQETMCALDEKIWRKYYPDDNSVNESKPKLHLAYLWLRNDIAYILSDEKFDRNNTEKDILKMIVETGYGEEILNIHIDMDDIRKEVDIRTDWESAFKTVKHGWELSAKVGFGLSTNDLRQLAKLHKSNKCRRKIEELLTDCNFHTVCDNFCSKKYDEFL